VSRLRTPHIRPGPVDEHDWSAQLAGTGKTAVSISNRVYRQAYGVWSQWGGTNAQACNAGQVDCSRSTGWFCDGAGTNNWKSWTQGTDNGANTTADWSPVAEMTC